MKGRMVLGIIMGGLLMVVISGVLLAQTATNSTFTYQGYLERDLEPMNGSCDFKFRLYSAEFGGTQIGQEVDRPGVDVYGGVFSVKLDFGDAAFAGTPPWLEVDVRCSGGNGSYETLSRIELTNAPRADRTYWDRLTSNNIPLVITGAFSPSPLVLGNTTGDSLRAESPSDDGMDIRSPGNDGVAVYDANNSALFASNPNGFGVYVTSPGFRGLEVFDSGQSSVASWNSNLHGLGVYDPNENGVLVDGDQDGNGIRVGLHGLEARNMAGNGLWLHHLSGDGIAVVEVDGLAGYFGGDVTITGTLSTLISTFGINVSDSLLQPGDIVSIEGVQNLNASTLNTILMEVTPAQNGQPMIGVVYGWAELIERNENSNSSVSDGSVDQDGGIDLLTEADNNISLVEQTNIEDDNNEAIVSQKYLVPREGPAQPGDYVVIIIYGPMQVKANTLNSSITVGTRVAAADNGQVRALQTVTVNGVQLGENVPTLGIALESLQEGQPDGLIWVLVNPQ